VDVRWHSVRAAVQRVSSAAVYWVRAGSDIARVSVQWMCAGSQTTNTDYIRLNVIRWLEISAGCIFAGLRCECLAATHDSTPTLCMRPALSEQRWVGRPRVICGAVHRTQHTNCTTHASHPQTPPPTPVISRHAVATHTTLPQICDTAHTALDTLCRDIPAPVLAHTVTTYPEIAHPQCPYLNVLLLPANTHTLTLFQIRFSNFKRASEPKNPPEASGCALAGVPSSCSCSWQASSTRSRATRAHRTRTASTRAVTTIHARALLVMVTVSTDSGQVFPGAKMGSGTPNATLDNVRGM